MRDLRHRRNIQYLQPGIADGLADHQPRIRLDGGAKFVERARLDEGGGDAEARQRVRQQVDGAAIERGGGDDVVAGIEQRCDRQMQRRHAARGADRADAGFQRCQPLFEHRGRRVGNAGVDMSGAFEIEQRRGVVGILKHVGRGLVAFRRQAAWVRACGTRQVDGSWMDVRPFRRARRCGRGRHCRTRADNARPRKPIRWPSRDYPTA